jgi:2-polyprenyl-6-methoxyphenol hydroxylase-like FAD-dependent oxidoreductase
LKSGKTYQRFEKLPNGVVKVFFEDGTTDECDLLIGADGVGSKVRSQLRPDAKVIPSDVAVIYFKVPYTPYTKDLLPTPSGVMVYSPFTKPQT